MFKKLQTIGGLQAVVQQSTSCPSGSKLLRNNTCLRKIDARSCVEWFDNWINRRNVLRRLCEAMSGFAKLLSPKERTFAAKPI